ncbi:MAG: cytochrome c [Acidobacteriota bacterium]
MHIKYMTICLITILLSGCRQDMAEQPAYRPLEPSTFFDDGRSARPVVPGTVARGQLREDRHFYTGNTGNTGNTSKPVETFPFPITREVVKRGQERYNIYCTPCHDRLGDGNGMIVQRGFRRPPSLHIERLQQSPVGHFYDVITNGFGAMPNYAVEVPPRDRWAITAYLRALQLSRQGTLADVPATERENLLKEQPKTAMGDQQ